VKKRQLAAAKLAGMVVLLIVGVGVSGAFADPGNGNGPPSTVPGSPGDDCSHGNADKDCRPDPNENGKDCEDHGNARGNEDHCGPATTTNTTPTTTTTTSTTTTNETTTTPTTETTTTQSTTTTTPQGGTPPATGTTPPATGGSAPPAGSAAGTSSPPTASPPQAKPESQKKPAKQAKNRAGVAGARSTPGELPFTGFPAWALALIGSVLLAAGLGLRRLGCREPAAVEIQ
jgi:hypothetical protein